MAVELYYKRDQKFQTGTMSKWNIKIFFFPYVVCLTPILLFNEKIVSMKELKSKVQLLFYFWKDIFPSTPSTTPPPSLVVNTSLVTLVEDTALQTFHLLLFISRGTLPLTEAMWLFLANELKELICIASD